MLKDQRIRDPIHNLVGFSSKSDEDEIIFGLINTTPVQRLRRIKQLGFSDFVYPGATHTRFSHVIGAMEMARRMLAVFEKNEQFELNAEHQRMRKATLVAALLHDIGHGPYSHVFEEISKELGVEEAHENITRLLLDDDQISIIIEREGIKEEVAKFFDEEPGSSPYTRIITSQMDCDRLDFLCRDRYHTGLQSSFIDLAWLFDSLKIENVIVDPVNDISEYSFVLEPKGIGVAEDFVLAYHKMYRDVYFHKTTRGVQHLIKDAIIELSRSDHIAKPPFSNLPIVNYWTNKEFQNPKHYLKLDDSSIIEIIHLCANGYFGISSDLSRRYLNRDLYKCVELPTLTDGEIKPQLAKNFFDKLKEEKVDFFHDTVPSKNFKQYATMDEGYLKNILVKDDGEYIALGKKSAAVNAVSNKSLRTYFRTSEDRDKAVEILRKP